QAHRHAFFDAVIDHLLTPLKLFELAQYLPRIVRMATACEDFGHLTRMIKALDQLESIIADCQRPINSLERHATPPQINVSDWSHSLRVIVTESVISALPPRLSPEGKRELKALLDTDQGEQIISILWPFLMDRPASAIEKHLQAKQAYLFSHD